MKKNTIGLTKNEEFISNFVDRVVDKQAAAFIDIMKTDLMEDLLAMTLVVLNDYQPEDDRYQDAITILNRWFPEMEKELM